MSSLSVPPTLARVPNALASRFMLSSMTTTQRSLLEVQVQLATGKIINRASDDPIGASAVTVLDDVLERREQRLRNLSHAEAALNTVDASLSDATDLLHEAHSIGLSNIGATSDTETRESQAAVIDSMLDAMLTIANRQFQDLHIFGGDRTNTAPFTVELNGVRYHGTGDGLETDLGLARSIPITMGGEQVFGALSARVEGERDLDPVMTGETLLRDLSGAANQNITLGAINIDVNGADLTIDLTGADSVQDIIDALQTAIAAEDPGAVVQIDGATGNRLEIVPSAGVTVTISDGASGGTAADLGIVGAFAGPGGGTGGDLNPRITERTPLANLAGVTTPLGTIRLQNGGQTRDVDLSSAETVQDVQNMIASAGIGIRVEISDAGDRLNFINELSGGDMSVGEVGGGTTATELGVRSLSANTLLTDFNDGLGVEIVSGSVDPVTGNPDPTRDVDFRVTVKSGTTFDVDLAGAETVQDVLDAINAAAAGAGLAVPADFTAQLAQSGNGIDLIDNTAGVTTSVQGLNGSQAAYDLGILGSTTSATLAGEDRATVAVDSVFTHLIALRDALRADDSRGISLATENLEADVVLVTKARATAGVRTRRVVDAVTREEDLKVQDESLRSQLRDLDYTEATIRFASLELQLQAALSSTARLQSLSLIDFLS